MSEIELLRRQQEAFLAYKEAKERFDETMTFEDAMAAKGAWWEFLNIFEKVTAEPRK